MTATLTPYRSQLHPARAHFGHLLHAEWTKFRTVRAWSVVLAVAAVVIVVVCQLSASGSSTNGSGPAVLGPGGSVVDDSFRFTHRPLTGDGSITARVTGLRSSDGRTIEPWAKAGVLVKSSLTPGSPYAAVLTTPAHGVRMQWNFTEDKAGPSDGAARWLRLTRKGDHLTGYSSANGRTWSKIADVRLPGLPRTVQAGLFAATPAHQVVHRSFGGTSETSGGGEVTATYDHLTLDGTSAAARWTSADVGGPPRPTPDGPPPGNVRPGSTTARAGTYTLVGHGDIAPDENRPDTVQMSFQGVFVGVLFMVALGALFVTTEYKRGLIRTTFTAVPSRLKVLAAKTTVIAAVTFVTGLLATAVGFTLAQRQLRANGFKPPIFPDLSVLDDPALRAVAGSAVLLALVAVLALGVGVALRSTAGAIATVVVLVILPQILSFAFPLPAAQWLLRVTPAAGFAIQQGLTHYPQVQHNCLPESGCYPLSPWPGLAVLAAYAVAALLLAAWSLRRRDA
ncbi:DUF1349 domain-containing protein [Streptomyces sp. 7R007]